MISKRELLRELSIRVELARERGDFRAAESYAATYHRVNSESEQERRTAGLRMRMASRDLAADMAALPLEARIVGGTPIRITRVARGGETV